MQHYFDTAIALRTTSVATRCCSIHTGQAYMILIYYYFSLVLAYELVVYIICCWYIIIIDTLHAFINDRMTVPATATKNPQ